MKQSNYFKAFVVLLSLCIDVAATQSTVQPNPQSMTAFNLYLVNMSFSSSLELTDKTSMKYNSTRSQITQALNSINGTVDDVVFSDGGGCVKAYIQWRNADQNKVMDAFDKLKTSGLSLNNQTWLVSYSGCTGNNLIVFKYYVKGLLWDADFSIETSDKYKALKEALTSTFSKIGGSVRTMKFNNNQGCVEIYLEWDAVDPSNVLELTSKLRTDGLNITGQKYNLTNTPCLNTTVNAPDGYKIRISGVLLISKSWTDAFNDSTKLTSISNSVKSSIQNALNNSLMVQNVKVRVVSPYQYMNKTLTLLSINIDLTDDHANEHLRSQEVKLVNASIQIDDTKENIIIARLGRQNITGGYEFCSGVSCKGICKLQSDDQFFCSCDSGYYGTDCSSFDCRSEISMIPNTTVNYCKNNGTCSRGVGGFKCTCPPGRYGSTCEANLCDYLDNPCSGQGVCVGSISDGKLCQCNSSRFGLNCESNVPENITGCEAKRRFMTFIDSSIRALNPVKIFKLPVKNVLKELDVTKYHIPHCLESDNVSTNKQFYSQCTYDVETGRQLACSCLSSDGTQNNYAYYGNSDCRANVATESKDIILSINTDWPDDSAKEEIQSQLTSMLQPAASYIYITDYTGRLGCVSVHMQVFMNNPGNLNNSLQAVMDAGIMIGGVKKSVSNVICDLLLNRTLVDFKLSVVNLNWTENYRNQSSDEYKAVQAAIQHSFENLNGSLRTLEIFQSGQGSCIIIYVQWEATNITNFLPLMDKVKNNGLVINSQNYSVSKPPCNITDESYLEFRLFVRQLPWLEEYKKNNSNSHKDFQTAISSLFKDIEGSLQQLTLIQRQECVEVFLQWRNANSSKFLSTIESVRLNGLQLGNQRYNVSMTSCSPASVSILNLKLYSNTFMWTDSYKNESSLEYQQLQQQLIRQLSSIPVGANLVNFKLNSVNGCVELHIELNETNIEFQRLMTAVSLNGSSFTTQPCSASSAVIYVKFLWNVTLDLTFNPNVEKQLNSTWAELEKMVNDLMTQRNLPGYFSSRIVGFSPEVPKNSIKVKRQNPNTVMAIESSFTRDIPVTQIFAVGQEFKSKGLKDYKILDTTFGFKGPCPSESCSNMSICVSLTNGTQKCACSDTYFGLYCTQKNTTLVCSDKVKCNSDKEKCLRNVICTGSKCEDIEIGCISKNASLNCDPKPCNNSDGLCDPCNGRGFCYNQVVGRGNSPFIANLKGYQCTCNSDYSGDACETDKTVCNAIPGGFCKKGCLGDVKNGQLCQCPGIFAGIWCNKTARSVCERRKVFYDDVKSLQNTNMLELIVLRNLLANYSSVPPNESCIQDACRNVACREGERCVVQQVSCNPKSGSGNCSVGVCRLITKPGVCPNQDISSLNKLLASGAAACSVGECYDDSDCDSDEKCCGLCSSKCTKPAVVSKCSDMSSMSSIQTNVINRIVKEFQNQTDPSNIALKRFFDNPLAWNTSCESDNFRYKPLQCYSDVSNSSKPPFCFCVDFMGKVIEGSKPNASDPASCNLKPNTCPYLDPPASTDSYIKCTSDLNCLGGDKCCSFMGGSMCATPVNVGKLTTTVDKLMSRVCSIPTNVCFSNGSCSRDWKTTGEICACPVGSSGLFCENSTIGQVLPSTTACQKKALASSILATGQLYTANGTMALVTFVKQVLPMFSVMTEVFSVTNYTCLDNGNYPPTLCDRFLNVSDLTVEVKDAECYCVDRNGQEILGTRMSSSLGQPFCGEKAMCPFGNAFPDDKGMPQECDNSTLNCPVGYACRRSKYGQMVCCLTQQALENICKLPLDQGQNCLQVNSTRYFYNDTAKQCQAFNFRGCGGNYNNFVSADSCTARCIQEKVVHPGVCPDNKTSIAKGQCRDKCSSDSDCSPSQKCCTLNCAKQCITAVDDTDKNLKCPFGQPRGPCDNRMSCGAGQFCNNGVCCIQYNADADFCSVPPLIGEACAEPEERYFFNSSTNMCQKFNYTGCQPEFNNFASLEDCCQSCNKKGRCKVGQCPFLKLGSVMSCRNECSGDGECPGKKICCSSGIKCGSVCVLPDVSSTASDCPARRKQAILSKRLNPSQGSRGCDSSHVPSCEDDGTWSKLQCQTSMGICWCTTPLGNYVEGSMINGVNPCQKISDTQLALADVAKVDVASVNFTVCPGGSSPRCCSAGLCQKPCPAYPSATCIVDPCGGCTVKHFDDNGNQVNCTAELSPCLQEVNAVASATLASHLTVMKSMGVNLDDDDLEIMLANVTTTSSSLIPDIPYVCQLPVDPGTCKGFLPQWYYDPATSQCRRFIWGMCGGNDNRFSSPEACYQTCNPLKSPCNGSNCSSNSICILNVEENCLLGVNLTLESCSLKPTCSAPKPASVVMGPYVPVCLPTGQYSYKQCYGSYCWCVYANGAYMNGLTDKGNDLVCTASGAEKLLSLGNCTNNLPPNISCISACNDRVCPNYPKASCVVDLCSSSCETRFVDAEGNNVTCGDDLCKPFSFKETVQDKCANVSRCPNARPCPQSICKKALEENCKSPCANCLLDPCTCQPYFVDVKTNQNLTEKQCKYLAHGACAIEECKVKKDVVLAELNDLDLEDNVDQTPQCTEKGKFLPKQCKGKTCQCIDAYGRITNETVGVNDTCPAIDEIKKINTTLTFDASFDNVSKENLLQEFKEKCIAKLTEFGIDNQTIKYVSEPYKGSVKINITLESDPNSANTDMSVVYNLMVQGLDYFILVLGNNTISLIIGDTSVSAQTASQDVVIEETKESSGLSERDKIIIGCVVGIGGGLILITIIVLCVCCYCKKNKKSQASAYDPIGAVDNPGYDKTPARMNQAYEVDEEDRYIKVKL